MTDGLPCVPGRLSSTLALIIYSLSTHFRIFGKKSAARPSPPSRAALRAAMSIFGEPFYRNWLVANSIYLTFLEREKKSQLHTKTHLQHFFAVEGSESNAIVYYVANCTMCDEEGQAWTLKTWVGKVWYRQVKHAFKYLVMTDDANAGCCTATRSSWSLQRFYFPEGVLALELFTYYARQEKWSGKWWQCATKTTIPAFLKITHSLLCLMSIVGRSIYCSSILIQAFGKCCARSMWWISSHKGLCKPRRYPF